MQFVTGAAGMLVSNRAIGASRHPQLARVDTYAVCAGEMFLWSQRRAVRPSFRAKRDALGSVVLHSGCQCRSGSTPTDRAGCGGLFDPRFAYRHFNVLGAGDVMQFV
jgi:hypothetical protein